MLDVKVLSELLTKNTDKKLYPRLFVMSPNGTLLAYSTPADTKELRNQAAVISLAWKEQASKEDSIKGRLETMTVEVNNNIIVRAIQENMLLVLIGTVPPHRKMAPYTVKPEYTDTRRDSSGTISLPITGRTHPQVPSPIPPVTEGGLDTGLDADIPRVPEPTQEEPFNVQTELLKLQRSKADVVCAHIADELAEKGFVMPEDAAFN